MLGHLGLRGGEEIRTPHEAFVTLHAKPTAAVGIAGAVFVFCFEEFPSANKAVIFGPSIFDESKVRAVFSQAEFEGKSCPYSG